tara:strand:- start:44 stop:166 length:123 start_codon:yes stop_codon:yes gene_type:complete
MTDSKLFSYEKEIKNNKEIIKYLKSKKTKKEIDTILSKLQ